MNSAPSTQPVFFFVFGSGLCQNDPSFSCTFDFLVRSDVLILFFRFLYSYSMDLCLGEKLRDPAGPGAGCHGERLMYFRSPSLTPFFLFHSYLVGPPLPSF